ncbi:DUF2284 domain-containing protein [Methanimicrococcus blatticola]|uniref:Putative metal-binding protein n=1 Tax=Methanimicrococcus blatticola TaxID=91560 RepID=A0A484F6P2_9EURY|nr:DUF2284 domain-containing protein [Methanimicrococcus blatticola]MBZ3935558.1 hypothetical protein [Methanimicrococcus blatticola]MCC2509201.1 DUF2284 domain-containing protein [Methanimicrococcus blatticola]TDQ69433.1 putative metal-binding protein [Methanimicrococcus blatticola]
MPKGKIKNRDKLSQTDKENVTVLLQTAKEAGAIEALYIDCEDVVVDDRVRLKCFVPLCRHYGDLVCPPNVPTPDEFRKYLKLYRFALLVSTQYDNPPKPASLADSEDVSNEIRKKSKDLSDILLRLEGVSLQKGYRFAAGFTGGSCHYCDSCVKTGGECKTPYRARPSMEAVGVDVVGTLQKVDMALEFPVSDKVKWWGLLLVD